MQARLLFCSVATACICMLLFLALAGDPPARVSGLPLDESRDGSAPVVSAPVVAEVSNQRIEALPATPPGAPSTEPLCTISCKAMLEVALRPVVGAKLVAREIRSGERILAATGEDGIANLTFWKRGEYQFEATAEGLLMSDSTIGLRAVRVPDECAPLQFVFAEPYVWAFAVNGEQPYDARFGVTPRGYTLEPASSPQAGRLTQALAAEHRCMLRLFFVRDIQAVPILPTSLFTRGHGIVEKDLPLVPLSLFSGPIVFDLTSPSDRATSAILDYRCIDSDGHTIELGPIQVRRQEVVAGFVSAWVDCNSQKQLPPGAYDVNYASAAFPWLLEEWLPQHRKINLVAAQTESFTVRVAEPMLRVQVQHSIDGLVQVRFGVQGPMGMSYGAAIVTNSGSELRIPASALEAIWYVNGNRRGVVQVEHWASSKILRLGQD
jgi:hypothetical protein